MEILDQGIGAIAGAVRRRTVSAEEVCRASLARAHGAQQRLNCFIDVLDEHALAAAREVDALIAVEPRHAGPLAGVPLVLKDNICLSNGRTTCASRILENYRSPFTATAAARLTAAGAVIIAKANMDEFGMGSSGENSAFGPTRNPHATGRVPGGSSSGSAAAVAAGVVPAALGSDTGGSIRQPAGFCGLCGVKPTYGRVSRWGLVAYASSLDQIGVLSRSVADAALLTGIIGGEDPLDSTCAPLPAPDLLLNLDRPVANLRIGVPRQARSEANHPGVATALLDTEARLRGLGATVVEVDLPRLDDGIAAYYLIATAEASSNLARFDGVRYGRRAAPRDGDDLAALSSRSRAEGFGAEVQRRIMLGTFALSSGYYDAYYTTAQKVRRLIRDDFDAVLGTAAATPGSRCHALLMPTSPGPAFRLGEKGDDPLAMYLEDVYTVGVNLAGLPAVAIPAGVAEEGGERLPVGVQLIGAPLEESLLLRIARMLERAGEGPGGAAAL